MTLPNTSRPVFLVRAARSDPDRFTRWSLEERREPLSWSSCRLERSALPASRTQKCPTSATSFLC
uniref:Uncharacterized protein n=1 Tax=Oncorhynchus tshawytscha TaxID=74940 RepID=A0A8C8J0A3_ONCTS